jgi:hypothetical protein
MASACAHRPSAADNEQGFRKLQHHEAALARAEGERGHLMQQGASECAPPMHRLTERVCGEASALCETSHSLRDRDANTRCLRARDTCGAAREHVRVRCATQAR